MRTDASGGRAAAGGVRHRQPTGGALTRGAAVAVNASFVGCSGHVYVDSLTPICAGAGQCMQPQTGTIDQGGSRANPWDNQYVYYFNRNATGFYYLRFYMDSYGNYSWDSGAG